MNTNEIIEGNKLIAEFMGVYEINGIYGGCTVNPLKNSMTSDKLKYHFSWDWLMPVIEKIEELGFWTKIYGFTSFDKVYRQCSIKKQKPKSDGDYIYNYEGEWNESKIEATWIAIIEFIKWWYNKQI